MKQPRNLNSSEREHISKSIANPRDWKISKKETDMWLIVHRFTGQVKNVLAP